METAFTERIHPGPDPIPGIAVTSASVRGTRQYQEDSLLYEPMNGGVIGAVLDGMGGLANGKEASQSAAGALSEYFHEHPFENVPGKGYWKEALSHLDRTVYERSGRGGNATASGTTIAAVFIREGNLTFGAAGDSMIYLIRDGVLMELVDRHNYQLTLEEDLRKGELSPEEYADEMDRAEELVSYLGMNGLLYTDCCDEPIELQDRDIVLICTDGLYRKLKTEEILEITSAVSGELFHLAAVYLIRAVLNKPEKNFDNISVVGFQYQKGESR